MCERSSGQSDTPPPPPTLHRFPTRAASSVTSTVDHEAYWAQRTPKSTAQQSEGRDPPQAVQGAKPPGGGAGPAGRPVPGCALTTHRAPSWSLDRRSRASAVSSPASQKGQGLRPPDPASCKMKAAAGTGTLNAPNLRKRRFARTHFRHPVQKDGKSRPSDGWARGSQGRMRRSD